LKRGTLPASWRLSVYKLLKLKGDCWSFDLFEDKLATGVVKMKDAKIGSYLRIWKFPECKTFFDVNIPSISEELLANDLGRIPVTIITEDSILY
jgi:hypothetical protein